VRVLLPERYAIHKLIVSHLRTNIGSKSEKHLLQGLLWRRYPTTREVKRTSYWLRFEPLRQQILGHYFRPSATRTGGCVVLSRDIVRREVLKVFQRFDRQYQARP